MSAAVEYTIRRKVFSVLGNKFHIYDGEENLVGYSKMKAFKLKEDIRIFRDESMEEEWLKIAARSIIDFGASYDITDSKTGETLGALRRKGLKSLFRDSWEVLDADGGLVGKVDGGQRADGDVPPARQRLLVAVPAGVQPRHRRTARTSRTISRTSTRSSASWR